MEHEGGVKHEGGVERFGGVKHEGGVEHSLYLSVALSFLSVCFSHLIQFPAFTQNYGILYPAEETSYYTQGNGPLYIERKHGILKGNNTKRKNTKMISLVKAKDDALRVGQGPRCRIHLERTKKNNSL